MLLTFVLATLGWVLFRADSINHAVSYLGGVFNKGILENYLPLFDGDSWIIVPSLLLMLAVEWLNRGEAHTFVRQPRYKVLRWMGYVVLIFLIICFMQTSEMPFIYFQF